MKKLSQPLNIPEKPTFHSFEIDGSLSSQDYQRNLPHLRMQNATYFVTFRLADSIPKSILQHWIQTKNNWLISFGIDPELSQKDSDKYKNLYYGIPSIHRHQFELEQHRRVIIELDKCHGSCVLEYNHEYVSSAIEYFNGKRVWVGDYVVMPNHVHVLVQLFPGLKLEDWLYSIKRFSSTKILKNISARDSITKQGHLWQVESYDRIVRNRYELARTRRYIANNPAKLLPGTFCLKQMAWLDEFDIIKEKEAEAKM